MTTCDITRTISRQSRSAEEKRLRLEPSNFYRYSDSSTFAVASLVSEATGKRVLITLPIHNEASRLESNVRTLRGYLEREGIPSVILLAEDGSTDNSAQICHQLALRYRDILFVHSKERLGRGEALRRAWLSLQSYGFDYKYYVFMDADLATDLSCLKTLLGKLDDGNDVVIGSRYAPNAAFARPRLRLAISLPYNKIVRRLFKIAIMDVQCGFKGFGPRALELLVPVTREDSCFWDAEICVICSWMRLNTVEIPVVWRETRFKRTSMGRLIGDMLDHGMGLIRLLARYGELRGYQSRSSRS